MYRTHQPNVNQQSTPRQLQIRGYYSQLLSCHWNLPAEYQQLWQKYSEKNTGTRSGIGAYMQANLRLLSADCEGLTQIDHPPPYPHRPPQITGFSWSLVYSTTAHIQWATPLATDHYIQIWHRLNWDYSPSYNVHWAQVATVRADCGQYDWLHPYPIGTDLFIKLRSMDKWGRTSPDTHTIKRVVPF